jgi:outer membrane protein assembly factor BamB
MPNHSKLQRSATLLKLLAVASVALGSACGNEPTRPGEGRVNERWFMSQAVGLPFPAPLVAGATVYFASGGGFVIARDRETGDTKWATSIGQSIYTQSAEIGGENFVLRNGVLVTAVRYHVSAIDAATGANLWKFAAPLDTINDPSPRPGFVVEAGIDADDNTVFVPAWGATVSAIDIATGQSRWVWRVEPTLPNRSGASGVRISGDTVFATVWHFLNQSGTQSEAWLVALNKQDGKEFWRVVLPREGSGTLIDGAPAVWRNLVIVTLGSGDLFAVDRNTQAIAWHILPQIAANGLGTRLITGAEVYEDFVYANGSDQKVHAYRAADGTELWASYAGQLVSDLFVTSKFVYGSNGASLYVLDRLTGAQYAALGHPRKSASYTFTSGATAANGRVFITISDGAWSFDEP